MTPSDALAKYAQLVAKVDTKFNAIHQQHRADMQCGKGCAACCKPGLTVSSVEAAAIKDYVSQHSEVRAQLDALDALTDAASRANGCALLTKDGGCSIYPVRPLVCRSHGAPLKWREKESALRDVCPLNFTENSLEQIADSDFIDLDTLNTLLALINGAFSQSADPLQRTPLTPRALLSRS